MLFGLVMPVQIKLLLRAVLLTQFRCLLPKLHQLALANKVTPVLLLGNITEFGKA